MEHGKTGGRTDGMTYSNKCHTEEKDPNYAKLLSVLKFNLWIETFPGTHCAIKISYSV
jgi:hypothetical protein